MACSAHVEEGDRIAVSAAVEQPGLDGGWSIGITRGCVLQGSETGKYIHSLGLHIISLCTNTSRFCSFKKYL